MLKQFKLPVSFVIFLVLILYYLTDPSITGGINMKSSNYRVTFGDINIGGKEHRSNNYTLDISLGQLSAQQFASAGYVVRAGFQYIHILYPFSFSLSDISVDFGTLLPDSPVLESITSTISHRGQGYEVYAVADSPLKNFSGDYIEDTQCNGGGQKCSINKADVWDSISAYGFGYSVSGVDAAEDFVNENYFRPFSSYEAQNEPALIMSANQAVRNRKGTITMKLNVSGAQKIGTYQTVVNFIAVPKF